MRHTKARIRYGGLAFTTKTPATTKTATKAAKEQPKASTPPKTIAYDSSKLLAAARREARINATQWSKGINVFSFEAAIKFASITA